MIDTAAINQHADLLTLVGRDVQLRRVASTNGGEYAGPCPFCGDGTDRFRVWPHADRPGWWCRQCERHGDAIAYLMQRDSLDFRAACERLGAGVTAVTGGYNGYNGLHRQKVSYNGYNGYNGYSGLHHEPGPPPADWQDRARRIVDDCEANLWDDIGTKHEIQ